MAQLTLNFYKQANLGEYKLQVAILENLQIKYDTFGEKNKQQTKTIFCVNDGETIECRKTCC